MDYNTKKCTKCNKEKNINEFYKDTSKNDGLYSSCKSCVYRKKDVETLKRKAREEMENEYLNKVFGFWKVESVSKSKSSHIYYNCKCVCGTKRNIRKTILRNKGTASCGCGGEVYKGKKFNRLTITSDVYTNKNKRLAVDVVCLCGEHKSVLTRALVTGATQSCGCLNKEILQSRVKEFHHNYNPKLTDEEREANDSRASNPKYKKFRRLVLKRDNNTCVVCGFSNDKNMRVHHLNSWNTHVNERYEVENAVVLCPQCHDIQHQNSFHNLYGNGNNTREQFDKFYKDNKITKEKYKTLA